MNNKHADKKLFIKSNLGFSLVEMLVAMFIGLFLLIGITTSYLSSKKSSITRDQFSILEDNGRIALEVLTNTLQHTGYRSTGLKILDDPFMTNASKPKSYGCGIETSVSNNTIFPVNSINDDTNGDSIGITYFGDDVLFRDCSGGILPEACRTDKNVDINAHKIRNTFFIDDNDRLQCAGSRSQNLMLIAEDIENMQILYGIDIDGDPLNTVDKYVSESNVGTAWGQVVSIQVAVLVKSSIEVKDKAETQSFSLLDEKYDSPSDRFQRAVFSTTINLRNL